MEKKNTEITRHAKSVSVELKQVKNDFNALIEINQAFGEENDDLKKRIRSNESDNDFDEYLKITKRRNKGKSTVRSEDEFDQADRMNTSSGEQPELNEKDARVCNNNYLYFLLTTNFIYLIFCFFTNFFTTNFVHLFYY